MNFTFDQARIDYIVNVLAQRPWAEANPHLQDIGKQMAHQQHQQQMPAPVSNVVPLDAKPNGGLHQEAPA